MDIFRLTPSEYLSQNELDAAALVRSTQLNVQDQTRNVWPADRKVGEAYLDQLKRTKGITAAHAKAAQDALSSPSAKAATVASELETAAKSAAPVDAMRLRLLATLIKDLAGKKGAGN